MRILPALLSVVLLLLGPRPSPADADADLRRARKRIEQKDVEGALLLIDRVLRQDPDSAPALACLACLEREDATDLRLRCLAEGRPFNLAIAVECLHALRGRLLFLPHEVWWPLERAAMTEGGEETVPLDPMRGREEPIYQPPESPCSGPLRGEAFGTPTEAWREALQRIEERFTHEGVTDALVWAELAVLLREMNDPAEAERVLARTERPTPEEEVQVEECRMRAVADPLAEWRRGGAALLERVAERGRVPREGALVDVCAKARVSLADAGDLEGLVRLVPSEAACWEVRDTPAVLQATVSAIARHWRLDDACAALGDSVEPARACLRSTLLEQMLQDDLAIETIERALDSAPEDLLLLSTAMGFYDRVADGHRMAAASQRLKELAKNRGVHVRWTHRSEDLEFDPLIETWASDEHLAAARFAQLLEIASSRQGLGRWYWGRIVQDVLRRGRDDLVTEALAHVDAVTARDIGRCVSDELRDTAVRQTFASLAVRVAVDAHPSPSVEAFVEATISCGEDWDIDRMALLALRNDLTTRPGFLSLPSARWILSLTLDPILQAEEARSLRAQAFHDGCRARGLLQAYAREGGECIDALRGVNPVEATLIEATRSADGEALESIVKDPEATLAQRAEARTELARSDWRQHGRLPEREVDSSPETPAARTLDELRHSSAYAMRGLLEDGYFGSGPAFLTPDLRRAAKSALSHGTWPEDVIFRASRSGEELARLDITNANSEDWAIRSVAERGPEGSVAALLDSPLGPRAAEALRYFHGSIEAVRRLEAAHPLDLRWAEAAINLESRNNREEDEEARARLIYPLRRRNADLQAKWLRSANSPDEFARSVETYLSTFGHEGVQTAANAIHQVPGRKENPDAARTAMTRISAAAANDTERNSVSEAANGAGLQDISIAIDRGLGASADASVRVSAILRDWGRNPSGRAARDVLEGIRRLPGAPHERDELLNDFAVSCVRLGDAESALDAWLEAWEGATFHSWSCSADGGWDTLGGQLLGSAAVRAALERRLEAGGAPLALWSLALRIPRTNRGEEWKNIDPTGRLWKEGLPVEQAWVAECLGLSGMDLLARWRGILAGVPSGTPAYQLQETGIRLARALVDARRQEDAVACLDAWEGRCGPLESSQRVHNHGSMCDFPGSSLRAIHPLTWDDFHGVAAPPEALSAEALCRIDLRGEAIHRLETVEQRGAGTSAAWASRSVRVGLLLQEKRFEEAARGLYDIVEGLSGGISDEEIRTELKKLCKEHPETRDVFLDRMLARPDSRPAPAQSVVDSWEARLSDADEAVRAKADTDLRQLGPDALPLLRALLASQDPEARARVRGILGDLAEPHW